MTVVCADPRLRVVGDLAAGGPFITVGVPGVAARTASGLLVTQTG
ncbi:hypothetical protein [Streptosporangium roseum]|nr:hypothetical protein [Streptosporangium roseum]